jgi:hypothetical protein
MIGTPTFWSRLLALAGGSHPYILVRMDAQCVVHSVERGGARAEEMVRVAQSVALRLLALPPMFIRVIHILRHLNIPADTASRHAPASESQIVDSLFYELSRWSFPSTGDVMDLFASPGNSRHLRWYGLHPWSSAIGVDGLSAPASSHAYAFPPFSIAHLAVTQLLPRWTNSRFHLLLVVPEHLSTLVALTSSSAIIRRLSGECICAPPFTSVSEPSERLIAILLRGQALTGS